MAHKPKKLILRVREALGTLCVGTLELSSSPAVALFEVNQFAPLCYLR